MSRSFAAVPLGVTLAALVSAPASAHLNPAEHGSLLAGFSHPFFGIDHLLAMVTVGVWAALLGGRAMLLAPAAFVLTMLAGYALALNGVLLPFVEPAVLASIVVLGLLAAAAVRLPAGPVAAIVAAFALFHGHAHGAEIGAAGALPYAAGFALATMLLHGAGMALAAALASLLGSDTGRLAARIAGAGAAVGGLALIVS